MVKIKRRAVLVLDVSEQDIFVYVQAKSEKIFSFGVTPKSGQCFLGSENVVHPLL